MNGPIDELYLTWLYGQVGDFNPRQPDRTYWRMMHRLFTKEFVWIVPNDDNRIADGKDLREEFADKAGGRQLDPEWANLGCSMLELMIGLSRRLAFEADGESCDWFWHIAQNVGLHKYNDLFWPDEKVVDSILDIIIWRTYRADGLGGFFPLSKPKANQRQVELWYQLNAYLVERG